MNKKNKVMLINKTGKPDNIFLKENRLVEKCIAIENKLPSFMRDYFIYIKGSVAVLTRLEYLKDILFFCEYLVEMQELTSATKVSEITLEEFQKIKGRDVNLFLGDYCSRYYKKTEDGVVVSGCGEAALGRRRSTLSTLFRFLYRNEQITDLITTSFNPIKQRKRHNDAIKRLEIDEVAKMLDAVDSGELLTEKEKVYWKKTRLRDKAILVLFVTYGLRLSELKELNVSSFNFSRGYFKIYRKRGKEVEMPINKTCELVILDYLNNERTPSEDLPEKSKDALFLSLQNTRMSEQSIRDLTKKYTSMGMGTGRNNGYSPHKLRATAATTLIQEGFSIYDVQNLLDHDNVTTTQLYAAHKKNDKRDVISKFEWLDGDLGIESLDKI